MSAKMTVLGLCLSNRAISSILLRSIEKRLQTVTVLFWPDGRLIVSCGGESPLCEVVWQPRRAKNEPGRPFLDVSRSLTVTRAPLKPKASNALS